MEPLWISDLTSWNVSTFVCERGNNPDPGRLYGLNETVGPEVLEEGHVEGWRYLC